MIFVMVAEKDSFFTDEVSAQIQKTTTLNPQDSAPTQLISTRIRRIQLQVN